MQKNLNKDLYTDQLFKVWSEKKGLLLIEEYFIKKYLLNKNGKIIEAGTGGGRIIFEIENMGYSDLEAFDFVENMISYCNKNKKKLNSSINFKVTDAINLKTYKTDSFDYLIYLQQVLCFIDIENLPSALKEAFRIGKDESIYLFSFLNWNSKYYNPFLSIVINVFRIFRGEKTNKHKLPWLKINEKINWKFLSKNQPQTMWYKEKHIIEILEKNGFSIVESKIQINASEKKGHIHLACKKSN